MGMSIQSQLMSIHSQLWEMVVLDIERVYVPVQPEVVTPELDAVAPPEEVAIRDEALLAVQADHDWADYVEQRGFIDVDDDAGGVQAGVPEAVYHLRYGGRGSIEKFKSEIDNGPHFAPTIRDLLSASKTHIHPTGARVLVYPEQADEVLEALKDKEVRPYDLFITSSKEHLLDELLATFPCRQRPSEKKTYRHQLTMCDKELGERAQSVMVPLECSVLPDDTNAGLQGADSPNRSDGAQENIISEVAKDMLANKASTGYTGDANVAQTAPTTCASSYQVGMLELIIKRTFLCEAPQLKSSKSVNQSTTEATNELSIYHFSHSRGGNPRRPMARDV